MTDTNLGDLGVAAGDIISKAFTLGYETVRTYVPAGGMALTAEDVRKFIIAIERHYPEGEAELLARLRAMLPATEPAERVDHGSVDDGMGSEWQRCKADCGIEVVRPGKAQCDCTEPTDEDEADDISGFMDALKASRVHNSAPAEPAEEETKARCLSRWDELRCGLAVGHAGSHEQGKCSDPDWAIWPGDHANPTTSAEHIEEEAMLAARGEGWYEGYEVGLEYGPIAASGEEYDGPINPYDVPASSPVVPAPTEASVIGGAAVALRAALAVVDPLEDGDWEHAWRTVEDLEDCAKRAETIAPTETEWQTWQEVPEGVTVKSANGERFRKTGIGAVHLLTNGVGDCCKISVANDLQPAPFVAAEEG